MNLPDSRTSASERRSAQSPARPPAAEGPHPVAWEEMENGTFRPRRIRGSCLDMELG